MSKRDFTVINNSSNERNLTIVNENLHFQKRRLSFASSYNNTITLFKFLFFVVFASVVISFVFGGQEKTFGSFLEMLQSVPTIADVNLTDFEMIHIGGDWWLLDGLRDFLNYTLDILSVFAWAFINIVNLIPFVFYFVEWLLL